jgi:dTDP-4-amino-4,6-dideoxygalactose transaminase
MRIWRTLPPAAAILSLEDLLRGITALDWGGRHLNELESDIKSHFHVKYAFLISSGKAALTVILNALRSLSSARRVVIPAYTCFSLPSSIIKAELQVTLCDIDASTLGFDMAKLGQCLNQETLCVVPNHLFGIPSPIEEVKALCRPKGIFVVEDAAQAMGGTYQGKKLGTLGDVGFFSFGRGKNITCGSGGAIITNSDEVGQAIKRQYDLLQTPSLQEQLRDLGQAILMSLFVHPALYWFPASLPFLNLGKTIFYRDFPVKKLSRVKAGLLRRWKDQLKNSNDAHRSNSRAFRGCFAQSGLEIVDVPYLRLPILTESHEMRDRLYQLSRRRGLGLSVMYPCPINETEELRHAFQGQVFPRAKAISDRLIALPTHSFVTPKDTERISALIREASDGGSSMSMPRSQPIAPSTRTPERR